MAVPEIEPQLPRSNQRESVIQDGSSNHFRWKGLTCQRQDPNLNDRDTNEKLRWLALCHARFARFNTKMIGRDSNGRSDTRWRGPAASAPLEDQ